jgi:hypothetical protein
MFMAGAEDPMGELNEWRGAVASDDEASEVEELQKRVAELVPRITEAPRAIEPASA